MEFSGDSVRARYFGVLTNDIVYKRLAPSVLEELKRVNRKTDSGRRKHKFFQHLTTNLGYPKLKEHLGAVVAFMQVSNNYHDFIARLDRFRPRYHSTLPFSLDDTYQQDKDDGKGI